MKYPLVYLSILAGLLFILPQVSAEFNGAKQNTDVNLTHSVRLDGFPVSNALCNITVFNPDKSIIVPYSPMFYNSTSQTFFYNLTANQTGVLGDYCYDVTCTASGINQTNSFCFPVTPSGKEYSIQESITYIFILILSIGLFILTFMFYRNTNGENVTNEEGRIIKINYKKHLKMFLGVMSYLIVTWIAYLGWMLGIAYIHVEAVGNFLFFIQFYLLIAIYPVGALYIIFTIITYIKDAKLSELVKRGIYPKGSFK